nr:serine palmitoyltransferase 2 [Onthophagus taurus]
MATRMDQGVGEASVTEVLDGFNVEKATLKKYSPTLLNGHLKKGAKPSFRSHLNGHVLTSSSDEDSRKLKGKLLQNGVDKFKKTRAIKESFEHPSIFAKILTQLGFYILMFLGYISQALFPPKIAVEKNREGYPPLYDRFSSFYSRYVYRRIRDCWNYPICSVPGAEIHLKDRITKDNGWTFEFTGTITKCLNLGSYNYLGFAENQGPCAEFAIDSIYKYGVSTGATRQQYGTNDLHIELEKLTAEFLGTEDAITFGMGFATNALNLPTLLSPGCLVISDERNHASLILGIRLSGATVKVFKHNDVKHLEKILQQQIYYGQPKRDDNQHKPWKKILIVVEGVYSMEGSIVRLPEIIELKKKYKAYLYLDEAHSIGAMGKQGKGIVDYFGVNPKDVDILMGTFTKSFGSAGGYIAGSKEFVSYLREYSYANKYAVAMSPPVAAQIIGVLRILMGKDGTDEGKKRVDKLMRNTRYFRRRLAQIGVITYGNEDSPVVPFLTYLYSKVTAVVRELRNHNIATVGVGYPATPFLESRIRICLSAAHTKEQLDYALETIEKVANKIGLKYSRKPRDLTSIDYDSIDVSD